MFIFKWVLVGVIYYRNAEKINNSKNPTKTTLLLLYTFVAIIYFINYIGNLLMAYGFLLEYDKMVRIGQIISMLFRF